MKLRWPCKHLHTAPSSQPGNGDRYVLRRRLVLRIAVAVALCNMPVKVKWAVTAGSITRYHQAHASSRTTSLAAFLKANHTNAPGLKAPKLDQVARPSTSRPPITSCTAHVKVTHSFHLLSTAVELSPQRLEPQLYELRISLLGHLDGFNCPGRLPVLVLYGLHSHRESSGPKCFVDVMAERTRYGSLENGEVFDQ